MTLGALFDLDGVLIDSERLYTKFWAEVGVRYSIPSPTFALDIKGKLHLLQNPQSRE